MAKDKTLDKALKYRYTDLIGKQIRIAHIHAGDGDGHIYVEISIKDVDDPRTTYNALSWQWGDQDEDPVIRIRDKPTGSEAGGQESKWRWMRVKPNLMDALKRLRIPDDEIRLWVDAICIQQVQKSAKEVKVWLGEPRQNMEGGITDDNITPEDVKKAVKYIDMLGNLDDTNHIAGVDQGILEKAGVYDLEPLFKLLRRGWFGRRWIIQEISVKRNVQVHCGEEVVSWKNLASAVALLERVGRDGTINRMLQKRSETRHVAEYVGNISALPAYRLVQNKHMLCRMRGEDRIWEQTLEQLVCFLAVFQASKVHDTIYAILGIASDFKPVTKPDGNTGGANANEQNAGGQSTNDQDTDNQNTNDMNSGGGRTGGESSDKRESFVVDYQEEPVQLFKRFLRSAMKKSRSLDILSRKPFQTTKGGRMIRYNADPLVGAAVPRLRFYSASGLWSPNTDDFFKIDEDRNSRHIVVSAFRLSEIKEVWDSAAFGNISRSWLEAGGWKNGTEPPDELWRTLVADRTHEGHKADPWYPMAFQSAARDKELRYGINTSELIHEKNNAAYSEVFRRVPAVVWNRRLVRTDLVKSHGTGRDWEHLGLAPEDAQVGDSIFIVLGCSVPLVLRLVDNPTPSNGTGSQHTGNRSGTRSQETSTRANGHQQDSGETYRLVGDCYIDDMMDGQAVPRGLRLEERCEGREGQDCIIEAGIICKRYVDA
ncbi:heterokaryon incompatibility protein-domain-containing protein [Hypoxylon sp. FL1150]|nr:heterokaryon incompatibility protein-domain-containing protein [Hypoxylon sp. FL1150]